MLAFALAAFFLFITPGPGVMSIAGVGSAYGYRPATRYFFGLLIGNAGVSLLVITGLAAILLSMPGLRLVLLVGSVAYLLYLAFRIAFSGARIAFLTPENPPGLRDGIVLQLLNPKAFVVNTTFFTGFAFWPESLVGETVIKLIILNVIWLPIHLLWLWAGVSLRRLNLPQKTQRAINMAMAGAMVLVVLIAVMAQAG